MKTDHATPQQSFPYVPRLDVRHEPLTVVDVGAIAAGCRDRWYNESLCVG